MAIETLFPNGDDAGWPTGGFANIDESIASADANTYETSVDDDVTFINLDDSAIVDGDTVNTVTIKILAKDTGSSGKNSLAVDLEINSTLLGEVVSDNLTNTYATLTITNALWNLDHSAVNLDGMRIRIRSNQTGKATAATWVIDAIDVDIDYTAGANSASGTPSIDALTASGTADIIVDATGTPSIDTLTAAGTVTQTQVNTGTPSIDAITASGVAEKTLLSTGTPSIDTITASGVAGLVGALTASGTPSTETITASGLAQRLVPATSGQAAADFVVYKQSSRRHLVVLELPWAGVAGELSASGTPSIDALIAAGTVTQTQVATAAPSIDVLTASGVSDLILEATAAPSIDVLTASGTVTQTQIVTGAPSIDVITASGVSSLGALEASGTPSIDVITAAATVTQSQVATGTPSIDTITASGVADVILEASGSPSIDAVTAQATVTQVQVATGTPSIDVITAAGTATLGAIEASGTPSIDAITASATVTQTQVVTGAPSIETLTASGASDLIVDASGSPSIDAITAAATVTQVQVATGQVFIDAITASGTATLGALEASGTPSIDVITAAGTVIQTQVSTAAPSIDTITASGVATGAAPELSTSLVGSKPFVITHLASRKHQTLIQPPDTPATPPPLVQSGYPGSGRVNAFTWSVDFNLRTVPYPDVYPASPAPPAADFAAFDTSRQVRRWPEIAAYLQLNALGVYKITDPAYYTGWYPAPFKTPKANVVEFKRRRQETIHPQDFPLQPTTTEPITAFQNPKQHTHHASSKSAKIIRLPRLDTFTLTIQSPAAYAPVPTIKTRKTARILQFPKEIDSYPAAPAPVAPVYSATVLVLANYRKKTAFHALELPTAIRPFTPPVDVAACRYNVIAESSGYSVAFESDTYIVHAERGTFSVKAEDAGYTPEKCA